MIIQPPEQTRIEWLIPAEHAEVLNGKLYLMGGGWDRLTITTGFPFEHRCALGIAFLIPATYPAPTTSRSTSWTRI